MTVLLSILALYCTYATVLFLLQRRLLFLGTRRRAPVVASAPTYGGQTIWLEGKFGRVEAWFFPASVAKGPGPALLFAHGNDELIDDWPSLLQPLRERGLAIMLVEYPGYGRSSGRPGEKTIRDCMCAAFDALSNRPEVDAQRIVAYGMSLGGGAVCTLLPSRSPRALILQSAFSSLVPFARRYGVPAALMRDRFDNAEKVSGFAGPVLSIHGTDDEVVPIEHARSLRAAARTVTSIDYDCGHNDCPPDWISHADRVTEFLREHGLYVSRVRSGPELT